MREPSRLGRDAAFVSMNNSAADAARVQVPRPRFEMKVFVLPSSQVEGDSPTATEEVTD